MTVADMKLALDQCCDTQYDCAVCPLNDGDGCKYSGNDDAIINAYHKIFGKPPVDTPIEEKPTEVTHDVINKPNHYCRDGAMECIDEMVLVFGKEVVKHFCLCNIWKYRYRSAAKNGEEDIKKSDRYVQIYKELTSNE